MTTKITNAIDALVDALREESSEQMTTFRLFVNCEERVIETAERTHAELKAAGISMRNLRGNFIRENSGVRMAGHASNLDSKSISG